MINTTTSSAEMLQNVMHVNTENIHKRTQGEVQHHPAWGSSWSPGFLSAANGWAAGICLRCQQRLLQREDYGEG